jgi:hypothetical protein
VPWSKQGTFQGSFQVSAVGYVLSGANVAWGVEYTYDDVFGLWLPAGTFPRALPLPALAPNVANVSGSDAVINQPVTATRLTVNTAPCSVQLTQQQLGT